jgi:hypothetical protein
MYYQPNSCTTHAEHEWAGGIFLRQWKKVPPAHAQQVYAVHVRGLCEEPKRKPLSLRNARSAIMTPVTVPTVNRKCCSDNIKTNQIAIETAKTGRVTAGVAVMSIFFKERCNLQSA